MAQIIKVLIFVTFSLSSIFGHLLKMWQII